MGTETILVTGGGGFVGLALCKRLISMGHMVKSFSRQAYPQHSALGITSIVGDIGNKTAIIEACEGVSTVFHAASRVGIWGQYNSFYTTNVIGTENLIQACIINKVKRIIYTSSASVIFDGSDLINANEELPYPKKGLSYYTHTKALAEQLLLSQSNQNLNVIALRPHLIWGPGDTQLIPKIIARARTGKMKKIGKQKHIIDTTFIDNCIDAHICAHNLLIKSPPKRSKVYFISNNEPLEIWHFINSILSCYNIAPIAGYRSENLTRIIALALENYHRLFQIKKPPMLTRFLVDELCSSHWFNISKAQEELGYKPRIKLLEGLKQLKTCNEHKQ